MVEMHGLKLKVGMDVSLDISFKNDLKHMGINTKCRYANFRTDCLS